MQETRRQVREIIARISRIDAQELADELNVREELGIDSLMAMEIIATIERKLEVRIDEEHFNDIETIGEFLDLIIGLCRNRHE